MSPKCSVGRQKESQFRKGDVTTEAETRVMQSQAKECQQPPEAASGKEWILPSSLQKEPILLIP